MARNCRSLFFEVRAVGAAPSPDALAQTYAILDYMSPVILANQGKGTIVMLQPDTNTAPQTLKLGDYTLDIKNGAGGAVGGGVDRGGAGAPGSGAAVYSAQSLTSNNCTFSVNVAQSGSSAATTATTTPIARLLSPIRKDLARSRALACGSATSCTVPSGPKL